MFHELLEIRKGCTYHVEISLVQKESNKTEVSPGKASLSKGLFSFGGRDSSVEGTRQEDRKKCTKVLIACKDSATDDEQILEIPKAKAKKFLRLYEKTKIQTSDYALLSQHLKMEMGKIFVSLPK